MPPSWRTGRDPIVIPPNPFLTVFQRPDSTVSNYFLHWWWIGMYASRPGYGKRSAYRIVGGTSATHLQVPPYKIQDRAKNVFPIIFKLWNFWQRGRLWFGFSEPSGSIWLFFNNNASLAPPPWFDITISLMIAYNTYISSLVPKIIVKRGHGCHIWGR